MFWKIRSKKEEVEKIRKDYEDSRVCEENEILKSGIKTLSKHIDALKWENKRSDLSKKGRTLDSILDDKLITEEEYNALCTGNRSDILYAFKLNENYIRESLVREAIEEGECE